MTFLIACRGWIERFHRLRMRSCSVVWWYGTKVPPSCFNGCKYPFHKMFGKTVTSGGGNIFTWNHRQFVYISSHLQVILPLVCPKSWVQKPKSNSQKTDESPRRKLQSNTKTEDKPEKPRGINQEHREHIERHGQKQQPTKDWTNGWT